MPSRERNFHSPEAPKDIWKTEMKSARHVPYNIILGIAGMSFCAFSFMIIFGHGKGNDVFRAFVGDAVVEYLVDTPGCKIPGWDPWDPTVKKHYKDLGLYKCESRPSFLHIKPNAVVSLDDTILKLYYDLPPDNVLCTYQAIHRSGRIEDFSIDKGFSLGPPQRLHFDTELKENYIKTECVVKDINKERTHIQYLPLTPLKPYVESKCENAQKSPVKPLNVIFLGIDSISRLNYIRHFPKTRSYIAEKMYSVSLEGYNKVGDNTFPNLMPMLTGHHYQYYWNESTNSTMYFDDVDLLWKEFSKRGYRTMLAEDAPDIATFNYYRSGFKNPPTDYYFRPFALAVENSDQRHKQCLGNQMEMEVLYEYLRSFVQTMGESRPYFAFVFLARLTHDVFNYAGYADEPTFQLIRYIHEAGYLNNTLLVFYSDHGIRFSDVRNTQIGQFEERLPFINLIFPQWFSKKYPKLWKNLETNRKRLTTPFDIHATMLDLLNLERHAHIDEAVLSSPAISLFNEVSPHRTCEHASIPLHWCTCQVSKSVPVTDRTVTKAVGAVIDTVNAWTLPLRKKCSLLTLQKVHNVRLNEPTNSSGSKFLEYLLVLSVLPSKALLEATVRCERQNDACHVVDDISRINKYGLQSACINNTVLRKFCFCK